MGVAALVLGILGVTICWIPAVGWIGVVLALVAVVLGIVAMTRDQKGLGITGLVLGAVGLILGLVIQILTLLAVDAAVDGIKTLKDDPRTGAPF